MSQKETLTIRPAVPTEARLLSALALRSKAHWGYPAEFLEACRAELTYSPEQLKTPGSTMVVAELSGAVIGLYALEKSSATEFELDALFVEPGQIGRGIGRTLLENAKETAVKLGGKTLVAQADPHAEEFYRAAGGEMSGQRESGSVPGRYLPVFTIRLRRSDAVPPDGG